MLYYIRLYHITYYITLCYVLDSPASRRGRDKRGLHRRATFPYALCFKCAPVATVCHFLLAF